MIDLKLIRSIPGIVKEWGSCDPQTLLKDISTDSRLYRLGEGFLALNGERYKGIQFVESILPQKIPVVILTSEDEKELDLIKRWSREYPSTLFIQVQDTLAFYQSLSSQYREEWMKKSEGRLILAITGSNGKTTTKEMVNHFLEGLKPGKVLCTEKNFNNHVGVPRTLLKLSDGVDYAIIEMGMNHPGELDILCEITRPMAGIITNVGWAHIEFFESQEGIFAEKRTLFDAVMKNTDNSGHFALWADDPFLKKLPHYPHVSRWGEKAGEWHSYYESQSHSIALSQGNKEYQLMNKNLVGEHNFINLANSFLLLLSLFPGQEKRLLELASTFHPKDNRSTWIKKNGNQIYMDAYNANPSSMKAALSGIVDFYRIQSIPADRQFYIIGDMYELGEHTERFHQELGFFIKELGIQNVAFLGKFAPFYQKGFGEKGIIYLDKKEFTEKEWPQIQKQFEYIFIKASRGMALETLIA